MFESDLMIFFFFFFDLLKVRLLDLRARFYQSLSSTW